jgi:phage tail tape-measure protein
MSRKSFIMIGMVIGSIAGGYAPILLGADSISVSLIGSTIGGLLGIWGGFKLYG